MIIANDPDADRFAAAEKQKRFVFSPFFLSLLQTTLTSHPTNKKVGSGRSLLETSLVSCLQTGPGPTTNAFTLMLNLVRFFSLFFLLDRFTHLKEKRQMSRDQHDRLFQDAQGSC